MASLELNAQVTGQGQPLVVLHGLFGSARNWASIARRLADIRQVHGLDLRNHGDSPWAESMTYEDMAGDVAAYIERNDLAPCDVLGHSMGGKAAMVMASSRPQLVERLVVVDIAPVAYLGHDYRDYIAAMLSIDLDRVRRRADVEAELAPAIPDPALRAFLSQNLVGDQGKFHWRLNLAGIGRNLPAIVGFPDLASPFPRPVTFLAGERSDYVRPRDEAAIRALFPAATIVEIGQSGHWPHAEQPEQFLKLVRAALAEL
jgi:pimeloyl-ACP methyl ester carboxylesterase